MRLDTRGNFRENFGYKVDIRNRTKVVEIIIRERRILGRGCTIACLNKDGKVPSDRDKFMILMILMPSLLKPSFKRKVHRYGV